MTHNTWQKSYIWQFALPKYPHWQAGSILKTITHLCDFKNACKFDCESQFTVPNLKINKPGVDFESASLSAASPSSSQKTCRFPRVHAGTWTLDHQLWYAGQRLRFTDGLCCLLATCSGERCVFFPKLASCESPEDDMFGEECAAEWSQKSIWKS